MGALKDYVAEAKHKYNNKPIKQWKDQGLPWAIQEYYSAMGELSKDDIEFLYEIGFVSGIIAGKGNK